MRNVCKPAKPPMTTKGFAEKICRHSLKRKDNWFKKKFDLVESFPCPTCEGVGYTRDYTGVGNDYNEEDCLDCLSSGIVGKGFFKNVLGARIDNYNESLKQYNDVRSKLNLILKKITKTEADFIVRYY